MTAYDAVVLAGGSGRRMGHVDKALVDVGGAAMLTRVLAAVAGARQVVCVGPRRATPVPVTWLLEQPPGGGPVAALAAALPAIEAEVVVVLAVDLPLVDAATITTLVAAIGDRDGAVALDDDRRAQPLLAAYRRDRLAAAVGLVGEPAGARARDLVAGLDLTHVVVGVEATDCDTPEQLRVARTRVRRSRP